MSSNSTTPDRVVPPETATVAACPLDSMVSLAWRAEGLTDAGTAIVRATPCRYYALHPVWP